MDRSRDAFAWKDEIYLNDIKDENELAQRYTDISYMCGIKDTVSMFVSLGLIKGIEAEE